MTDWLTDRPTDRPTDWLTDWLTDWQTDWPTDWWTDWLTDWLTDWRTDGLTDWQTDWLTGRLADWRDGHRQTEFLSHSRKGRQRLQYTKRNAWNYFGGVITCIMGFCCFTLISGWTQQFVCPYIVSGLSVAAIKNTFFPAKALHNRQERENRQIIHSNIWTLINKLL